MDRVAELAVLRVVARPEDEALVDAVADVGRVVGARVQVRARVGARECVLQQEEGLVGVQHE